MTILQISDTHNRHQLLTNLPMADVIVHCGDFTDMGTEEEGNFAFFLPIGLILESVLPNELEVMNDREVHINHDEAFIDFKVLQV